jgi:hypothetical protein
MKYKYLFGPGRKEYVSEFGQFLNEFMREHPEVKRDQELGWRIWWERPVDPRNIDQEAQANLKPDTYHSYYYE